MAEHLRSPCGVTCYTHTEILFNHLRLVESNFGMSSSDCLLTPSNSATTPMIVHASPVCRLLKEISILLFLCVKTVKFDFGMLDNRECADNERGFDEDSQEASCSSPVSCPSPKSFQNRHASSPVLFRHHGNVIKPCTDTILISLYWSGSPLSQSISTLAWRIEQIKCFGRGCLFACPLLGSFNCDWRGFRLLGWDGRVGGWSALFEGPLLLFSGIGDIAPWQEFRSPLTLSDLPLMVSFSSIYFLSSS
jgi:hypothetical protein